MMIRNKEHELIEKMTIGPQNQKNQKTCEENNNKKLRRNNKNDDQAWKLRVW